MIVKASRFIRLFGLVLIFGLVALASDNRTAHAACTNVFAFCGDNGTCNDYRGEDCTGGTPACPGQFVCGSHENCDEDAEAPVAIWCMMDSPLE